MGQASFHRERHHLDVFDAFVWSVGWPNDDNAQAAKSAGQYDPEVVAKRTRRHLDELERSNYAETSGAQGAAEEDEDEAGGRPTKGRGRQAISDKLMPEGGRKKKSAMVIRTAVLYKKTFNTLLDEADLESYSPSVATYLTATAPPPTHPPRMICSYLSNSQPQRAPIRVPVSREPAARLSTMQHSSSVF
ncbi:hypothetical protein EIP91_009315 [Steccherinum ochraceum]|uniref:Uncharacterized protein n=1 Tax=Steccherinum ochraceum TaxID=92696 RepID=A0A4R0REP1_9APHY|nr:hypothetical protein EIP91_009315 [Steccherinum ochraceum]